MAEVKIIGKAPFGTEIYVNGEKVQAVSSYTLTQNAGELPSLNLIILATELDINSPVKIIKADPLAGESTLK
ncbi:hypothetical protein [Alkaliphilus sp. B6464]|uniref:hypothetical protein n=1 Tax=Alkaliphilus sp. B6464 TaxID=2731219 RepID=UPI001BACA4C2|nr:hypothetical protein [Alkaliphilus sp. B6464]QUH21110.1 hypothetical protein HYG84_15285 [Alkaliphilus sp. B6464]